MAIVWPPELRQRLVIAGAIALAVICAGGAIAGVVHGAFFGAVVFRALTSWRLCAAAMVLLRREPRRWAVRIAAIGSALAHSAMVSAVAIQASSWAIPSIHQLAINAARCNLAPAWVVPLSCAGLAHAFYLWRAADRMSVTRHAIPVEVINAPNAR
jgi:hypothetical protein